MSAFPHIWIIKVAHYVSETKNILKVMPDSWSYCQVSLMSEKIYHHLSYRPPESMEISIYLPSVVLIKGWKQGGWINPNVMAMITATTTKVLLMTQSRTANLQPVSHFGHLLQACRIAFYLLLLMLGCWQIICKCCHSHFLFVMLKAEIYNGVTFAQLSIKYICFFPFFRVCLPRFLISFERPRGAWCL